MQNKMGDTKTKCVEAVMAFEGEGQTKTLHVEVLTKLSASQ